MRRRKGEERYEQKKMAGSRRRGAALPCSDGLWKRWRRTAGFLRRAAGVRAGTGTGDTDNRRADGRGSFRGEIDRDGAFALALENAEVPEDDAYNVKVEKDRENDISIWQVEFETDYGDYEYEIASADGRIVGADYEVDEEWLDSLGGSPVDEDGARSIAAGKAAGLLRMRCRSGRKAMMGGAGLKENCFGMESNMSLSWMPRRGLSLTGTRI